MDSLAEIEKICQHRKIKLTALRRQVLQLIWNSDSYIKAYDIIDQLRPLAGSSRSTSITKPPTVYRSLNFLLEQGFIHRINSLNAYVRCDHPQQRHNCFFLICNRCQSISECCNNSLTSQIVQNSKRKNFFTQRISLEVNGICDQCQV